MTLQTAPAMMAVYPPPQVTITSGSGVYVFDDTGRRLLDLCAGIATTSLGHGHLGLASAVARQTQTLVHVSNLFGTLPQRALAERLASLSGGMRSFFCNSGAEAIEAALKLVRRARPGRVVAASGSFHGRTLGALGITGQPAKRDGFGPLTEATFVPFGDGRALEVALRQRDVAAVILEPIQGEGGVVVPPDGYLATARALCDRAGALLVLDEVQTGVGRTGQWFAHQHEDGVRPDIVCLAKGLGGGLPIGACLATPEVADAFGVGDHGSTFGGGPVQTTAALTVLDALEDQDLVANARRVGAAAFARLARFPAGRARGRGLLLGLELDRPVASEIAASAVERGVLVSTATDRVVRITPPLVITEEEMNQGLSILEEVVSETASA